ncbi:MAG TPA: phosphodiester glycosidase family protein [Longimicrobium sp.]|jgi:uncharacterized protein YigE (DUF2233 family)|uniref:phosphodiester glycosidase family protein n=1 Tax=Longimicrobium sp. TaxID=2029185 RepID=UPI002ED89F03
MTRHLLATRGFRAAAALAAAAGAFVLTVPAADGHPGNGAPAVAAQDTGAWRAERIRFRGQEFHVVTVDVRRADLTLELRGADGRRYGRLGAVVDAMSARGRDVLFAMNAGMFHPDYAPVGLLVQEGVQRAPLNARDSTGGNFYIKPNGVFWIAGDSAGVRETDAYRARTPRGVRIATQSGPLLVRRGVIHRAFRNPSRRVNVRNGVGVRGGRTAVFVISAGPVDMNTLATLYRDVLRCPDALYLDGGISRMYAPSIDRRDRDGDFAGILVLSRARAPR